MMAKEIVSSYSHIATIYGLDYVIIAIHGLVIQMIMSLIYYYIPIIYCHNTT